MARSPLRTWAATLSVALAVTLATATAGGAEDLLAYSSRDAQVLQAADAWIGVGNTAYTANTRLSMPGSVETAVESLDVVASARAVSWQRIKVHGREVLAVGAERGAAVPLLDKAGADALDRVHRDGAVVVSSVFARAFDVGVGDTLQLGPDQPTIVIADVVRTFAPSSNGALAVSLDALQSWTGSDTITTIDVRARSGTSEDEVLAALATVALGPGVDSTVMTGRAAAEAALSPARSARASTYLLALALALLSGVAVRNTLVSSVVDRRVELAVLSAIGSSRQVIRGVLRREAVALSATGVVLGLLWGESIHLLGTTFVASSTPFEADFTTAWMPRAVALALGIVPVWLGLRSTYRAAEAPGVEAVLS